MSSVCLTGLDGDGEAFHGGDGESSEQRTDADVDEDVGASDPRREIQHEDGTQYQHQRHVHKETWHMQTTQLLL